MPWSDVSSMDQKLLFIADYKRQVFTFAELCRRFGVSRKTGYKWARRFDEGGVSALNDRSCRPCSCPHKTSQQLVDAIIEARKRHPSWGAKKLLVILQRRFPEHNWPARSTIQDILKRNGLVKKTRRRPSQGHPGRPETHMDDPNSTWTADFKGQFRTRDGRYCYPLTIADGCSRFLIRCQALYSTAHDRSQTVFEAAFREYGLPAIIRTDNGSPFATCAIARLSQLSVWWIRLGIYPELIELGRPDQNGRHERMHRTLKAETTRPPSGNLPAQQRKFNRFRYEFNYVRPHEALEQNTPAMRYEPSVRRMPGTLPEVEYPSHWEVRLVSRNGGFRWNGERVPVSQVLQGEYVGLEEVDNEVWSVYFGHVQLGRFHERELRVKDALGRKRRRRKV